MLKQAKLAHARRRLVVSSVPMSLILLAGLAAAPALARSGVPPASFRVALTAPVDQAVMPPIDEERYLREDEARLASELDAPFRFAAPIPVSLSPGHDGTWEGLPDGGRVWRLEVISTGARSLNFGFDSFRLPPGASVYFYARGSGAFDGPYGDADAAGDGQFWSAIIPGDDAVCELDFPARAAFEPDLTISQVGHDYRGFAGLMEAGTRQGSCNIDVVCPVAQPWANDVRAEGVYTLSGQWTCSGQLINSISTTPPPYFLTAYHCGIGTSNASSIVVYWNFISPTCGRLCCGSLSQHQSGSTFKAKYSTSDFCLVQLNQTPADSSRVYYAGWMPPTPTGPAPPPQSTIRTATRRRSASTIGL